MTPDEARPFYERFGWAYDLLVDDPVEPWVDVVCELTPESARVLDAGCGTGRQAAALAARGRSVFLVEASPTLLELARERLPGAEWALADLRDLNLGRRFEAVACRAVLNDIIEEAERRAALSALAAHVAPGGVLALDVRDRDDTIRRYGEGPGRDVTVDTPRGELRFTAEGWADGDLVRSHERHELRGPDQTTIAEHEFAMRPWGPDELRHGLHEAGLGDIEILPSVDAGRPDRRLVTARSG